MDFREIHIPVEVKDGELVLRSGKEFPAFAEGAIAEIRISANQLLDQGRLNEFLKEHTVVLLSKGATLLAEINPIHVPTDLRRNVYDSQGYSRTFHGVPFELKEDLCITMTAGKKGRLEDCECYIPSLELPTVSINESYTRISEKYEPHRRSHTGNVFAKVFATKPTLQSLNKLRHDLEQKSTGGGGR